MEYNLSPDVKVFGVVLIRQCADTTKPCVEWYKNDNEMMSMVATEASKNKIADKFATKNINYDNRYITYKRIVCIT